MNFKPLGEYVLVKPAEKEHPSGLVLDALQKTKPDQGTVVEVGTGKISSNGTLIPPSVKPGDYVLFHEGAADILPLDGVDYLLMRESAIVTILE